MSFGLSIKTAADLALEVIEAAEVQIAAAVDQHVEARAQALGYNSAATCASYRSSTVESWAQEAEAFIAWRDAVWLALYEQRAQHIAAGTLPTPDMVLDSLPVWGAASAG